MKRDWLKLYTHMLNKERALRNCRRYRLHYLTEQDLLTEQNKEPTFEKNGRMKVGSTNRQGIGIVTFDE